MITLRKHYILTILIFGLTTKSYAQDNDKPVEIKKTNWYESINLRGYMQVRYNRLLETNAQLKCEQCDRSWGENGGFFIRRMRLIFFGQIHKNVYLK